MAEFMGLVRALDGEENGRDGWMCKCPAHGDKRTRHLHVSESGGKVLLKCHHGCTQDEVISALADLGLWNAKGRNGSSLPPLPVEKKPLARPAADPEPTFILPVPEDREDEVRKAAKGAVATWDYRDRQGHLLYIRARFNEPDGGKKFLPFALADKGPIAKDPFKGKLGPLFNLEALAAAGATAPVLLVEGERCAEVASVYMQDAGMPHVAMTWPGGSGTAKTEHIDWEPLRGRNVTLWPDKDKPGADAMDAISKALIGMGCRVSRIEPPAELPEKGDIADLNKEDWSAAQIRAIIEKASAPELRFKLQRLGEIGIEKPDWLVRGFIEREELSCLFGDPSTYKSFAAVDMAACIATGTPFHGHSVAQGPVIYIAGEGRKGIRRRFRAWELAHGKDLVQAPIFLAQQPTELTDDGAVKNLIEAVQYAASTVGNPAAIFFDTLARNFGPGDENSTQDMNAVVAASDKLRALFRCMVLFVHHTGLTEKGRGRGSSVLFCALDSEFRMDKDADDVSRLEAIKTKDGELPPPMAFKLQIVDLGITDDEGADVTSCVLEDTTYEPAKAHAANLSKWESIMLQALREEIEVHRSNYEKSGRDPETARVTVEEWRDACLKRHGVPKQRFYDRMPAMIDKGIISEGYGFMSIRI